MTAPVVTAREVVAGRRAGDWHVIASNGTSIFFWLFGVVLDEKHKPSMSRIMLALWTYTGWLIIQHELSLKVGDPSLQNAVFTMWWAAEGVLAFAVFGPSIASYFAAGAAGAVTGLAASTRDALAKIGEQIESKTGTSTQVTTTTGGAPASATQVTVTQQPTLPTPPKPDANTQPVTSAETPVPDSKG